MVRIPIALESRTRVALVILVDDPELMRLRCVVAVVAVLRRLASRGLGVGAVPPRCGGRLAFLVLQVFEDRWFVFAEEFQIPGR